MCTPGHILSFGLFLLENCVLQICHNFEILFHVPFLGKVSRHYKIYIKSAKPSSQTVTTRAPDMYDMQISAAITGQVTFSISLQIL